MDGWLATVGRQYRYYINDIRLEELPFASPLLYAYLSVNDIITVDDSQTRFSAYPTEIHLLCGALITTL